MNFSREKVNCYRLSKSLAMRWLRWLRLLPQLGRGQEGRVSTRTTSRRRSSSSSSGLCSATCGFRPGAFGLGPASLRPAACGLRAVPAGGASAQRGRELRRDSQAVPQSQRGVETGLAVQERRSLRSLREESESAWRLVWRGRRARGPSPARSKVPCQGARARERERDREREAVPARTPRLFAECRGAPPCAHRLRRPVASARSAAGARGRDEQRLARERDGGGE
jgi:hypothetical protein